MTRLIHSVGRASRAPRECLGLSGRLDWRARRSASLATLAAFVLTLAASSGMVVSEASASEVVDVRVGLHATFTRIVFELDTPAGYRIERSADMSAAPELVVSVNATSIPHQVQAPRKALIGLVTVVPQGDITVARVRLTKPGLRVKEMILASPPRIVFDVMSAPPSTAKKKLPTAVAATPKPKAKARVAAKATPKPKAQPKPSPPPVRKAVQKPADRVAVAKPPPTGSAKQGVEAVPEPARPVPTPTAEPSEGCIPTLGSTAGSRAKAAPRGAKTAAKPPNPALQKKLQAARMSKDDSSFDMQTIALLVGALVVAAVAAMIVLRRRRDGAEDAEYEDQAAPGGSFANENPFSDLASEDDRQPILSMGEQDPAEGVAETLGTLDANEGSGEIETPGEEPAFDTSDFGAGDESTGEASGDARGASMELGGDDTVVSGIGSPGMVSEPEASKEMTRMMQEFERRIASLESRLDEVVDARERLERQVAAQTEELRVQRAAIARTQRAVRNLSRSDDDGATEPALRDPN